MKNALLPIVTAALLVTLPAAAESPESCSSGTASITAAHRGAGSPTSAAEQACARIVKAQFRGGVQSVMSDKEIERALKRQGFQGRLVEMIPSRGGNQVKVLWESREGGRRKLRTLIVDAKTGKFIREERR